MEDKSKEETDEIIEEYKIPVYYLVVNLFFLVIGFIVNFIVDNLMRIKIDKFNNSMEAREKGVLMMPYHSNSYVRCANLVVMIIALIINNIMIFKSNKPHKLIKAIISSFVLVFLFSGETSLFMVM